MKARYYFKELIDGSEQIFHREYTIEEIEKENIKDYIHRSLFTGKYDKNNVEIYYDDILSTSSFGELDTWDKYENGFVIVQEDITKMPWFPEEYRDSIFSYKYIKIEGNTIQNKNLLEFVRLEDT